jgi:hypothetical protein
MNIEEIQEIKARIEFVDGIAFYDCDNCNWRGKDRNDA